MNKDTIQIKKSTFITILVCLVVIIGGLIGFVIYDTLEINNLKSATPTFNGEFEGRGRMNGGNMPAMNGEAPEFNGEAPELPEGEIPTPEGGNVSDSESNADSSNSSKPSRGSKTSNE